MGALFLLAKITDAKAIKREFEIASMQNVELAKTDAASTYFFHGALIFAAPGVSEGEVIQRDGFRLEHRLGLARDRGSPIDERSEHVEKQGLHRKRHRLFIAHGGAPCQSGGDVKIQSRE